MRRLILSVVLVLSASNALATWNREDSERIGRSRHFVAPVTAGVPEGARVVAPLTNGRQLVRVPQEVAVDASFERLTPSQKIDRRALRAATAGKPFTRLTVQFHDDVAFEAARQVIYAAGGTIDDPLQYEFDAATRVRARIPSSSLLTLASDERVLIVFGPQRLRPALDNATTATMHNVAQLHEAPYGLTGKGVVLSFFEFAPADAAHPEFGGRLTTHLSGTESGDIEHATHVAGTMIASGVQAAAKGMAPDALLHQFSARGEEVLNRKQNLTTFAAIADNNSWGFILGWCGPPSCDTWTWDDTEEYYGAYDEFYVAPLDRISRSTDILFVHSAGNDATKRGPEGSPHAHKHTDDQGEIITGTFCYSQDGSGTDCPAPGCTAGNAPGGTPYCEKVRHPQTISELPTPYGSIGLTASAKNIVAVGAVNSARGVASFSSRGPTRDGRVKPEVVARGVGVYSTRQGNTYTNKQGTSMAAPAVAGIAALLTEQWRKTFSGADPTAPVLKTLLIAGAEDLGTAGPDYNYGFGLVNAKTSVDLILADGGAGQRIKQGTVDDGTVLEYPLTLAAPQDLRVTLGWSDPEVIIFPSDGLATATLVNDLDVAVITPSGETVHPYVLDKSNPTAAATRAPNRVDNTEMLEIAAAAAGTYRVVVTGRRITAQAPQKFVLVANGSMQPDPVPCADESNVSEAAATALFRGTNVIGRVCADGDFDFFTFSANTPGMITVTVTATDTALRATLSSASTAALSADVPAGQSRTLTLAYDATTATTFFVRVQPVGTIGDDAAYSIVADYPFNPGARRRVVGR